MTLSELADDRREIVDRYFARVPGAEERSRVWMYAGGGVVLIVLGVLIAVVDSWLPGTGVVAIGVAALARGLPLYEAYRDAREAALPKPRDAIIDKIRDHELAKVRRRALERLDLTAEDLELEPADWDPLADPGLGTVPREPLVVTGPVPTSRAMRGDDGVWRFSQYAVLVLCPTDYHLALYRCVIDLRVAGPVPGGDPRVPLRGRGRGLDGGQRRQRSARGRQGRPPVRKGVAARVPAGCRQR